MTRKTEDAADKYSFRLSKRNSRRLQDEMKSQDVGPTEILRSIVVDYLDQEEVSNRLYEEIEGQLSALFEKIYKEQREFREEIRDEMKENRVKIRDAMQAMDTVINKYIAHIEVLENNTKLSPPNWKQP